MKKSLWLFVLVLLSVFLIFGSSLAWQGRMAGMSFTCRTETPGRGSLNF
ncbi:MAG: hypothetical protein JRJ45_09805 [Deltaproteobacteria bacterium]|nr:hypothetical protein [Deltaproteobacteria bacterium]